MTNDHTFSGNFGRFVALVVKEAPVVWCQYTLQLLLLPVGMKNYSSVRQVKKQRLRARDCSVLDFLE
jgi:hypothetical protein